MARKTSQQLVESCAVGVAVTWGLCWTVEHVWLRMALVNAALLLYLPMRVELPGGWAAWVGRPSHLLTGALWGVALWGVGYVGFHAMLRLAEEAVSPALAQALAQQMESLMAFKDDLSPSIALPLLAFFIMPMEEVSWRVVPAVLAAALLSTAPSSSASSRSSSSPARGPSRLPWLALMVGSLFSGVAFSVAHAFVGPPILMAACLSMGSFWAFQVLWNRSFLEAYACHLVWDVLVMYVVPYV